jgi:hypothetical protein
MAGRFTKFVADHAFFKGTQQYIAKADRSDWNIGIFLAKHPVTKVGKAHKRVIFTSQIRIMKIICIKVMGTVWLKGFEKLSVILIKFVDQWRALRC